MSLYAMWLAYLLWLARVWSPWASQGLAGTVSQTLSARPDHRKAPRGGGAE